MNRTERKELIRDMLKKHFVRGDKKRNVVYISSYDFAGTDEHFEFALTEFQRTRLIVIIGFDYSSREYEIWNIVNFETTWNECIYNRIQDAIVELNSLGE